MRNLYRHLQVVRATGSQHLLATPISRVLSTTNTVSAPGPSKAGNLGSTSTVGERALESFAFDFDTPLASHSAEPFSNFQDPKLLRKSTKYQAPLKSRRDDRAAPTHHRPPGPKLFRGEFASTAPEELTERINETDQYSRRQAQGPEQQVTPPPNPQRFSASPRRERHPNYRPPPQSDYSLPPRKSGISNRSERRTKSPHTPKELRGPLLKNRSPRQLEINDMRTNFRPSVGYIDFNDANSSKPNSRYTITYSRLRELCDCPKCIHPTTRQRIQTSGEVYAEMKRAGWFEHLPTKEQAHLEDDWINISWDAEGRHQSKLRLSTLQAAMFQSDEEVYLNHTLRRRFWDRKELEDIMSAVTFKFEDLYGACGGVNARLYHRLLEQVQKRGFVKISGVPTDQTDNDTCTLRRIAETIGPIRNTFYGELWDVKNKVNSTNVAYTDLNLGLHMDLLYMQLPPRFQLLHCLRNRVQGGESYFVDSPAVATDFEAAHPDMAYILKSKPLKFVYENDGHSMSARRAVLPATSYHIGAVAWSPPFQGVLDPSRDPTPDGSRQDEERFLDSIHKWEQYLNDPKYKVQFRMEEGDLVIFDNRRVLHARTAFRECTPEERAELGYPEPKDGESSRWLKGCYLDGGDVFDRLIHWKRLLDGNTGETSQDEEAQGGCAIIGRLR